MAYFLLNSQLQQKLIFYIQIAIVRILIYVGWRAECYKFFFFILLHVFGRCRETMTGENSRERHPHPTTPNVDLELVFRHGIMDRPWLQRKRTDTLTTYNFFFFFNNPPLPTPKKPQTKHFAPVSCRIIRWGLGKRCWLKRLIILTIILKEKKRKKILHWLFPGEQFTSHLSYC